MFFFTKINLLTFALVAFTFVTQAKTNLDNLYLAEGFPMVNGFKKSYPFNWLPIFYILKGSLSHDSKL